MKNSAIQSSVVHQQTTAQRTMAKLYIQAGRVSEILAFDNRICFD